ncbi:MAG: DUF4389 domain-containing protein [Dehalococcoidia bacterium]
MTMPAPGSYPVRFDVDYPTATGRWLILVRWILAIPQLMVANVLQSLARVLAFIAFFIILFTKQYPEPIFRLVVGASRWNYNVMAYILFHDSPYPPFSFDDGAYPYLHFDVQRAAEYNRWLPLVKWLLAVPHLLVLAVLGFLAVLVWFYAVLAVVVTGSFPRGAFEFLVGVGRWSARISAYLYLQVDQYPPFSMR